MSGSIEGQIGSDHNLAVITIRLSIAVLKQQKKQLEYNTANLLNTDILASFDATIGGKFQVLAELDEVSDINEEWANFTTTINKAATGHLEHRRSKQREWINIQSRDLRAKRKAIKPAPSNGYRKFNRQTKASVRNDKKDWYSKIADELESLATCNNMREVYQQKNIIIGKTSTRA